MEVQMVYKKSLYDELSLIKKIFYIIDGGSKYDTLEGFTKNKNIAKLYVNTNYYKNLYIKEVQMTKSEYRDLRTNSGDLKLKAYKIEDDCIIIIRKKDVMKLIKEGVCFL